VLVVRDRHADVVGVGGELGGRVDRLPAARVVADGGVHHAVSSLAEPAAVVCAGSTPAGERLYRGQAGVVDRTRPGLHPKQPTRTAAGRRAQRDAQHP